MLNLILLGPPGAGKGTQAVKLKDKFNIPHISTGDIFRENIKKGTELGVEARGYMDKGELVPDSLVIELVKSRLSEDDCGEGFLLDGFPRTVFQAEALADFLTETGKSINMVIDIFLGREELISRISGRRVCRSCGATYHITGMPPEKDGICDKCGGELYQRPDDDEKTAENRIDVYDTQTKPLISYYESSGNIIHIDSIIGHEKVFLEILKATEA